MNTLGLSHAGSARSVWVTATAAHRDRPFHGDWGLSGVCEL